MTTEPKNPSERPPEPDPETEGRAGRRRARRIPTAGMLVALDAPDVAPQPWVVDALDINSGGLGLVLPPELPDGARVLLSFSLDDEVDFSQLPATVLYRQGVSGGVRFDPWPDDDRLKLLEFLVQRYESEG